MARALIVTLALLACVAAPASARLAEKPWPPATGKGQLFVHFGEEHINDADGGTLLPKVVGEVSRYDPALVTLSGDKANNGVEEEFTLWDGAMKGFERAGVPFLAGAGNHDRTAPPGAPGGVVGVFEATTPESFDVYKAHFAKRPYPWGDAKPYPNVGPAARPADDPAGAAATYVADVGDVRWIFLDNSCWSLSGCDAFQARADGGSESQFDFLQAKATQATKDGKVVFVVMHIPTRDPRDQSYTDTTAFNHVMGKGLSPTRAGDNPTFERIAAESGVDGVFLAHIKGQFLYQGDGDVPYYIDGGAGGELYTTGPVGTDHGYWHGFRLIRVNGKSITTDTVPIFVDNGITVEGPDRVAVGEKATFLGFGKQPVFNDPAKVERLELRDPAPMRPPSRRDGPWLDIAMWLVPLGLVGGFVLVAARWRRPIVALAGVVVLGGAGAVAVAQQSEPTTTPKESLPVPARVWTSGDARVLVPVAAGNDDPRRDRRTQTTGGVFRGRCPGRTSVIITSGFEETAKPVVVPSRKGRLIRSVAGVKRVRRAARSAVARIRPAQPVVARVRIKRGKKTVATVLNRCVAKPVTARWNSRRAARGRYTVETSIRSDRRPIVRRTAVRVR